MAKITDYPETTVKRKIVFAENNIREEQVDKLFWDLAAFESDNMVRIDELEIGAIFMAMKKVAKAQLAAWRQFRTKNGMSNDLLEGRYIYT